ncbi:MAG: thiaminase II [Clostridium celatum]|nr:thiaminase II [Clostridium celatum]
MKFSEELFNEVKGIWDQYLKHPFVKGIGEGTLDKEKFKNYLIQDYLYLKDYAKVFAMGLVKARTMKEMKFYHDSIKGVLDDETAVHVNYLKGFGLSTEKIEKYKVELTTASYTSYMLGIALKGDSKDIAMTIMPCTWSYYYIGKYLYETYKDILEENFYSQWIKEYASEEFRQCTEAWIDYINEICENISEDEKERLKDVFIKSSLYEMEFWNMANK